MKYLQRIKEAKTDQDRTQLYQEMLPALVNARTISAKLSPDGTFQADDVPPGKYEAIAQSPVVSGGSPSLYRTAKEFEVPEAKDKDDDSKVDWGEIELQEMDLSKLILGNRQDSGK